MARHATGLLAAIMLATLTGACSSVISDPLSMLPISEQAYLRTQVASQPQAEPVSVDQMLQNVLAQTTGDAAIEPPVAAPPPLELGLGEDCQAELKGAQLVAMGEFLSAAEAVTGLAGRIEIAGGSEAIALCSFQQASRIVRLLDGTLVDILIAPSADLMPGELRVIAEPLA